MSLYFQPIEEGKDQYRWALYDNGQEITVSFKTFLSESKSVEEIIVVSNNLKNEKIDFFLKKSDEGPCHWILSESRSGEEIAISSSRFPNHCECENDIKRIKCQIRSETLPYCYLSKRPR